MSRTRLSASASAEPPTDHRRGIGLKIAVVARQMRQRFDERVERIGVTRAKWVLIASVAGNPGTTQREIAAKLEVSDVTAGRMIDRVCADGLIERRANPQDRRAYRIFLTEAAQPVMAKLQTVAAGYERDMFACFDEGELAMLDALLDKLSSHIGSARREPGERRVAREPSPIARSEAAPA